MSRLPRVQRLRALRSVLAQPSQPSAALRPQASFAASRGFSTSTPNAASDNKTTDWVRGKLWKGDKPPGAEDPYTQRPEPVQDAAAVVVDAPSGPAARGVRNTMPGSLTLPPKRNEAPVEQAIAQQDSSYTPATSLEELEELPVAKRWWDQEGHWGEESQFRGFARQGQIRDKDLLEVYLRAAMVEVLALKQSDSFSKWVTRKWRQGGQQDLHQALALPISAKDGKVIVEGDVAAVVKNIRGTAPLGAPIALSKEEAQEIIKAWDPSWKDIPVSEAEGFAIRKRLYQLTGTLVSDARLAASRTIGDILILAAKPTKEQKVAEVLLSGEHELPGLSNVAVHKRKIGPIDRERSVGRWKVIEEELKKRGLPVLGSGGAAKHVEKKNVSENMRHMKFR